MESRLFLLIFLVISNYSFSEIEYFNKSSVYTPLPFIPSMITFSVEYIVDNDMKSLNTFEFYYSYVEHSRLFTVDKFSRLEFKDKNIKCIQAESGEFNSKELIECGRVLALSYVDNHSVVPEDFGFQKDSQEVVVKSKKGVFYFYRDGEGVVLYGVDELGLQEGSLYSLEFNLSPYGDYDMKDVDIAFSYEAYLTGASLIGERRER